MGPRQTKYNYDLINKIIIQLEVFISCSLKIPRLCDQTIPIHWINRRDDSFCLTLNYISLCRAIYTCLLIIDVYFLFIYSVDNQEFTIVCSYNSLFKNIMPQWFNIESINTFFFNYRWIRVDHVCTQTY